MKLSSASDDLFLLNKKSWNVLYIIWIAHSYIRRKKFQMMSQIQNNGRVILKEVTFISLCLSGPVRADTDTV